MYVLSPKFQYLSLYQHDMEKLNRLFSVTLETAIRLFPNAKVLDVQPKHLALGEVIYRIETDDSLTLVAHHYDTSD